jgi:predicted permease
MEAVNTVLPILLILALGAALTASGFLSGAFSAALNRVVYWVALPALIIAKLSSARFSGESLPVLLGVFTAATLLTALLAAVGCRFLGVSRRDSGTLVQGAFRGNLAYIAIPILAYSFSDLPRAEQASALSLSFVVLGPVMVLYNILAVYFLQRSDADGARIGARLLFGRMAKNPLILAALLGLLLNPLTGPLPVPLNRTLETLGQLAIPGALLCIGSSLSRLNLQGNKTAIVATSLIKVAAVPVFVALLAMPFSLGEIELRLLLIFAAAPTAAASHVMAVEMGGNEDLAAGTIAVSTLLSPLSLVLVLILV